MPLHVTFLTLFPESLASILDASILGRARAAGLFVPEPVDLRAFSPNKHRTVDDSPCGGGAGMVLRVDVAVPAVRAACAKDDARGPDRKRRIVLVEPRGAPFRQADAERYASLDHLVIVCGRYEGVDARVEEHVDEVVSIGDYVLTGGELPALVITDAVVRLLPGALGNSTSAVEESHAHGALEHRHFTKPIHFEGRGVPPVLLGGNHRDIDRARRKDALLLTRARRPDLFSRLALDGADRKLLEDERVSALDPVPVDVALVAKETAQEDPP